MNSMLKFGMITAVVVGSLAWLAMDGISESMTYYVTIEELANLDDSSKPIRVGGDVEPSSIVYRANQVEFTILQAEEGSDKVHRLNVVYTGTDPLPDTFRDNAQALCDGQLRADGVFEARKIQAKCASKYESEPGEGMQPVYDTASAEPAS